MKHDHEPVAAVRLRAARLLGRAIAKGNGPIERNPWREQGGLLSRAFIAGYRSVKPAEPGGVSYDEEGGRGV
ncbi:hypothetical protein GCM10027187_39950 [Streptosporangium sandarakinum]|uniref:Uncharacterized protein n=1 Tax=Streptosporangium sandarakinum TaxID=1260955 RepID=A0A852VBR3_9ACTN|nr:hypothetical protein [Streptosporangium sandarakinum]NYF44673.1 hypothetical protein [Streptosporangium sandarakinum]